MFFVLAWVSAHVGDPTEMIRLPSIVLGTATVPLTYLLGRRTVGPRAALLAAGLLALNPFSLWESTDARPYATLMFCSVLSSLLLLRAVESPGRRHGRWAAYSVSVAAVAYAHYTGVFVLTMQTLWVYVFHRELWRSTALATLGACVLYIPWLPYYHGSDLAVYNTFGVPLELGRIVYTVVQPLVGHPGFGSFRPVPGVWPSAIFFFAVVVVAVLALRGAVGRLGEWRAVDSTNVATRGRPGISVRLGTPIIVAGTTEAECR